MAHSKPVKNSIFASLNSSLQLYSESVSKIVERDFFRAKLVGVFMSKEWQILVILKNIKKTLKMWKGTKVVKNFLICKEH
jgi:hypothetical protein